METITAISTPHGTGAIGIIRISGDKCLSIISQIFKCRIKDWNIEPRHAYFGEITDDNQLIDRVVLTYFKSPNSYTGEDLIEISAHGNRIILEKISNALFKRGIIMAEPGEFTRRAFINGKMDLLRAEAVEDIILAESELALSAAEDLLSGKLSVIILELKNKLIDIISGYEAEIEFPDESDVADNLEKINSLRIKNVISVKSLIEKLCNSFDQGIYIREGLSVSIFGAPNTGKSTLLNKLIGYDRALVSDKPGTTRDYIREKIMIKGVPVTFIDMAGMRMTANKIEKSGILRSKDVLKESTLAVFVLDGSRRINKNDNYAFDSCPEKIPKLLVVNKSDCPLKINLKHDFFKSEKPHFISALKNEGITELIETIKNNLNKLPLPGKNELVITHLRHKQCLIECDRELTLSLDGMQKKTDIELIVYHLKSALKSLQVLTGEVTADDILNNIFSHFCIGK